ncbi:Fc.00g088520.m01.CDS01 [Cosmosporella sp. VM-42]
MFSSTINSLRSWGRPASLHPTSSSSRDPTNPSMPSPQRNGENDSLLGRSKDEVKRFWDGFIDFAFQGNILQLAFGLILAAAFTDLVRSFVKDILMPPISVLLPLNKNMGEKFAVLQPGANFNKSAKYNTIQQAQDDGAVVMTYGAFVTHVVSFLMIGLSLYGLALFYTAVSKDPIIKHLVKCKYCRSRINQKAKRCVMCTSWQDGREERVQY